MTGTPTTVRAEGVQQRPGGTRRAFDLAYAVLAVAFVLALCVQMYLAGAGAFAHHSGPHVVHHAFAAHEHLGDVLGIAAIVLFVLALVAHVDRTTVIAALVLALLTEVAQHGLAQAGHDNRWVGGLHAFDGVAVLLIAVWQCLAAVRRHRDPQRARPNVR